MSERKKYNLVFKTLGPDALLVEWPANISLEIMEDVHGLYRQIVFQDWGNIIDIVPSFHSIAIYSSLDVSILIEEIEALYHQSTIQSSNILNHWKIPVCYDREFGIDLNEISNLLDISADKFINDHCSMQWKIGFIGFLPGFPYCLPVEKFYEIPRKKNPRLHVNKGSVAIASGLTGIYPTSSPGGWQIIGNCPLALFSLEEENPCLFQMGDTIQFYEISKDIHEKILLDPIAEQYLIKEI